MEEQPGSDRPEPVNIRDLPPPTRRQSREITVDLPPYHEREGISAADRLAAEKARRPSFAQNVVRVLVGAAVVAAVLVGLLLVLGALDNSKTPTAPWAKPGAPVVRPTPMRLQ